VHLAVFIERDVQPEHEFFDGLTAVAIVDGGGLQDQERVKQKLGPQQRALP
jgi:hypothetical protein